MKLKYKMGRIELKFIRSSSCGYFASTIVLRGLLNFLTNFLDVLADAFDS